IIYLIIKYIKSHTYLEGKRKGGNWSTTIPCLSIFPHLAPTTSCGMPFCTYPFLCCTLSGQHSSGNLTANRFGAILLSTTLKNAFILLITNDI
ncbi:hypothetical protein, partial [uncultured Bacteroides sp.]|uniref:hypothetical protein n=1 Tax=uncultured Bacteroides sp. TaxID=162156 RepID=UPI00259AA677